MHHVILADSIDGGVLMILLVVVGLAASVMALIALIPAWQGSRSGTLLLAAPAFIAGVAATICFVWWYLHEGIRDHDNSLQDYLVVWVILAGPPFATSLLAVICLWFRRARAKNPV
jgi:hypothetical protein